MINYRKKQEKVLRPMENLNINKVKASARKDHWGASIQKFRLGYSPRYYGKRVVNEATE
jgi:hypothetical protein